MKKLTKEQAIIISAYTGYLMTKFSDVHEDVERRLKRPIWNISFGSKEFAEELREIYRSDFIALAPEGEK